MTFEERCERRRRNAITLTIIGIILTPMIVITIFCYLVLFPRKFDIEQMRAIIVLAIGCSYLSMMLGSWLRKMFVTSIDQQYADMGKLERAQVYGAMKETNEKATDKLTLVEEFKEKEGIR